MTKCECCTKQTDASDLFRQWIWIRQGDDGVWLCSWQCVRNWARHRTVISE